MGKIKKIIFILSITLLLVNIIGFIRICNAAVVDPDFYDPNKPTIGTFSSSKFTEKVGWVLGAIRNISAVVAVIILMIIGIKYIIGSVEEKANYKATMLPYVIGCIMAVAGTTLVSFIYNFIN